jgi:hypothetical protein
LDVVILLARAEGPLFHVSVGIGGQGVDGILGGGFEDDGCGYFVGQRWDLLATAVEERVF